VIISSCIKIAGELASAIIGAIMRGEDLEPLISTLPPESQKSVRREAEKIAVIQKLRSTRNRTLGEE
jgi:ribosomal 50S subunit-associated protein YjgA (DUF615 family)